MALKTIKEQAATDLSGAQYDTGLLGVESATYTPPGGDPVPDVTVRLRYGLVGEDQGADALGQTAECLIQISDVATVQTDATLLIGATTWVIMDALLVPSGLEWLCDVAQQ